MQQFSVKKRVPEELLTKKHGKQQLFFIIPIDVNHWYIDTWEKHVLVV